MKTILILFEETKWEGSEPFGNEKYRFSYEYFYNLCLKNEIQLCRAAHNWFDYEKGYFKYAWSFRKGNGWEEVYGVKPSLVYDKTKSSPESFCRRNLIGQHYKIFNHLEFTKLVDNKLFTFLMFPKFQKKNLVINSSENLKKMSEKLNGTKVVMKPLSMSGGEGVSILEKNELSKVEIDSVSDSLIQEFIDSSAGIPGVMKGVHDLRLVFIDNKLIYSYYRTPAKGKLLANLAQGGEMVIVPLSKLPDSLEKPIEYVQRKLSIFERKIYTIDFMFDEKGTPWIIELNSKPGMYFAPGQEETREKFYQALINSLKGEL